MRQNWIGFRRRMFLVLLVGTLLCLGAGAGKNPDRGGTPGSLRHQPVPGTPAFDAWMRAKMRANVVGHFVNFQTDESLARKEDDDFLLTPALLVQEAVSDGVVLTYPEE